MFAEASDGVRGELDLMSNIYTIGCYSVGGTCQRNPQNIFRDFCIIKDLLFSTIIILSYLFLYLDFY